MTELDNILTTEVESPEYERFLALNIQVPKVEGKRYYERVTISSSLRDLADDLSLVLPNHVRRALRQAHETHDMVYKSSSHRLPSPNPKRDPYVVVCSCGEPDCEHVQYAVGHFHRVMAFSQNAGQIAQHLRASSELAALAEHQQVALAQQLEHLQQERDQLAESLELAETDAQIAGQLQGKLNEKDDEIARLRLAFSEKAAEVDHHRQEAETAIDNLNSLSKEWLGSARRTKPDSGVSLTNEVYSVIQTHFMPPSLDIDPKMKFQVNVFADHHRVPNTHSILMQLAQLEFVRQLGISYRRKVKSGKVQIVPEVDTVEVLVPHNGEADIIRVLTTAVTKPQQMLAAHLVAAHFDLEVKL